MENISIDILGLTNGTRNMYGLRHQDYQRYRKYCSRRIHTLRKALGLLQGKKRFQKKEMTPDMVTTPKHLELTLIMAEKCWAHAMELKRNHHDEHGNQVPSHMRHHESSWLKKASLWADKLKEYSDNLQTNAYAETMKGYVDFEKGDYQKALDHFSDARNCYETISKDADSTLAALSHAAIDNLDPSIRYCAYNLRLAKGDEIADIGKLMEMLRKGKNDMLGNQVSNLLSKSLESKAQETKSIEWRNKSIQIRNPKLAQLILNAQEVAKVEPSKEADQETSYDQIISAWWDAQNTVDGLVREDELARRTTTSSRSQEVTEDLLALQTYVGYSRILATMARNQAMIQGVEEKLKQSEEQSTTVSKGHAKYLAKKARQRGQKVTKKEDLVRLWDETVRSCEEILSLPGVEQDPALQAIWNCKKDLAKATRYMSMVHGDREVPVKLGLLQQCLQLSEDVEGQIKSGLKRAARQDLHGDGKTLQDLLTEVEKLKNQARRERLAIGTANVKPEPLQVVEIPPKMEPVACKPLLFDLASNDVDYRQSTGTSGIRGWIGGWLRK